MRARNCDEYSAPPAIAAPLVALTGLTFGISLIGANGLWDEYTSSERAITALMCTLSGLAVGLSLSIAIDRRITSTPWMRIAAIAALLVLACGGALVRRSLVLDGV
jgi:hypothetical protein